MQGAEAVWSEAAHLAFLDYLLENKSRSPAHFLLRRNPAKLTTNRADTHIT